jgi:hypothetical protein
VCVCACVKLSNMYDCFLCNEYWDFPRGEFNQGVAGTILLALTSLKVWSSTTSTSHLCLCLHVIGLIFTFTHTHTHTAFVAVNVAGCVRCSDFQRVFFLPLGVQFQSIFPITFRSNQMHYFYYLKLKDIYNISL